MAMMSTTIPMWLSAAVLSILYLLYRSVLCKPLPGIPYNEEAAGSLLGDIPTIRKIISQGGSPFHWIATQTVKHKSPVIQVFFRLPMVVVSDFREVQDILQRRTREFDRSEATAAVFVGVAPEFHMNKKSEDEEFKAHRHLLRDLMTPAFLNQVAAPQLHASISNLVQFWSLKARLAHERPFDARSDLFDVMLDSMTAVTFGLDIGQSITASRVRHLSNVTDLHLAQDARGAVSFVVPERPQTYEALTVLLDTVFQITRSPLPQLYFWYRQKTPSYRKAYRLKEDMINAEIAKAVNRVNRHESTQRCALDNVLQREATAAHKVGRAPEYNSRAISDELFGFLLAGSDTSTATMSWGFKFLSANPSAQEKLRMCLHQSFPDALAESRSPTADEIVRSVIPYLDATVEEIHRCGQIFPMTLRRAQVDTTILGFPIPKGTDIALATTGPSWQSPSFDIDESQRSETSQMSKHNAIAPWDSDEAKLFRPERWLKTDADSGLEIYDALAGPVLPFSSGPRGCFGRRLASLQLKMLIVLVVWNLELLEIEGELGEFKALERFFRLPAYCYLKLRAIQ